MSTIRIAMAQVNATVGALKANSAKARSWAARARSLGADIVLFPELTITGYPPEDLLHKRKFVKENRDCLDALASSIKGITAVVGFVDGVDDLYNAAAVIHDGRVAGVYRKMRLPNYGVFDEERYFRAGERALNFKLKGVTVGVEICEDVWSPDGPARSQALAGAELIVNINASPYHAGKTLVREQMLAERATENMVVIAYNNAVGGQDELVFDGGGMVVDYTGRVVARGAQFEEDLIVADVDVSGVRGARRGLKRRAERGLCPVDTIRLKPLASARKKKLSSRAVQELTMEEEVLKALVLGTRDYVSKNGFKRVVIGLSGGIDSSLVAAVAVEALGRENVTGVFMPSRYTSKQSRSDAVGLARHLGIELIEAPIEGPFKEYLKDLKRPFRGKRPDTTEENLQARIRGNILMALSNKFGWLVLTTGNKSEMSVGYATLYGDMAGGFAVIKDVPKTLVYELCAWINRRADSPVIPASVFTKAPTAELKFRQTDQDTLPPYSTLDPILKAYVEEDWSLDEIASMGYPRSVVARVIKMVDSSEYKRRQAPPGIKITTRAFGRDRRMPITNAYADR